MKFKLKHQDQVSQSHDVEENGEILDKNGFC